MHNHDDEDDEDGFSLSSLTDLNLDYDISQIPGPFKSLALEQICAMNNFLVNSLEEEGKLMEMLTWSSERIKSYETAIIQKHKAERGIDDE
jgi:hypothetical protein